MKTLRIIVIGFAFALLSALAAAQDAKLVFAIEGRGEFTMTLNQKAAPRTAAQILRLASSGFYNGQRFHRSVQKPKPFLVQVGDPESKDGTLDDNMRGGSGAKIPFEANDLQCELGAVLLAREGDKMDSGDSQFFILLGSNRFMNGKYTVFAQITAGIEVVKSIQVGDKITSVRVIKG